MAALSGSAGSDDPEQTQHGAALPAHDEALHHLHLPHKAVCVCTAAQQVHTHTRVHIHTHTHVHIHTSLTKLCVSVLSFTQFFFVYTVPHCVCVDVLWRRGHC